MAASSADTSAQMLRQWQEVDQAIHHAHPHESEGVRYELGNRTGQSPASKDCWSRKAVVVVLEDAVFQHLHGSALSEPWRHVATTAGRVRKPMVTLAPFRDASCVNVRAIRERARQSYARCGASPRKA